MEPAARLPAPRPPIAPRRPRILEAHGESRVDPYYWLRQKDNPEVIAYLKAENAYADVVMRPAAVLEEKLYREILGRVQETDTSAPTLFKGWWTYTRTVEGLDYEIYCRRRGSMDAPEEVLLDGNELAKSHEYFDLGFVERSPDEKLLAYAVDLDGSERHELRFRDLATGTDLDDVVRDVYYGSAWAADSRTFFYSRPDHAMRPYQVWRHVLGTSAVQDVLVMQEDDEHFELGVELTKSERYIVITSSSQVTSESHFLRSDAPDAQPQLVEARRHEIEYSVDDQEDRFLIVTNDGARNFRLMSAPISNPGRDSWSEVVPEREGVRLNFIDVHVNHVVLGRRSDGLQSLEVLDSKTGELHVVEQPDAAYTAYPGSDPKFDPGRLSLLDRGFVFAIAHVRGGGELGRAWYEGGKFLHKTNTFGDFIACAELLVELGYTSPRRLAIRGRSAGGLLIGAVLNIRPDLFGCAVAQVPFVDALTTMLDDKLPLTVNEFEEWGNPAELDFYEYMKAYSPYDNVHQAEYPALLVTAGLNDPRVSFWEPAKWVAKLRALNEGEQPVLLKTEMGSGHMGPSGRYESWREEAFISAFVIEQVAP